MGQREQDLELPLLPIGELAHQSIPLLPQVPLLQQAPGLAQDVLVAGEGAIQDKPHRVKGLHGQQHVLLHGQIGDQGGDLKGACQPQRRPSEGGEWRYLSAKEEDPPRTGRQLPADQVEECRLAGAVGPKDGPPLSGLDLQGQVVQGLQPAKIFAQPLDDQCRHCSTLPHPTRRKPVPC